MDPTTWISKLDQSVKSLIILGVGATVCAGFLWKLIAIDYFMPFAYMVIGAAFGRGMQAMAGFTKTTETTPGPEGKKTETVTVTPPSVPPVAVPPLPTNGGTKP